MRLDCIDRLRSVDDVSLIAARALRSVGQHQGRKLALKFVAIYGSVRSERQGITAARFLVQCAQRRGHEVTLIDPIEYPLPLLDRMYRSTPLAALRTFSSGWLPTCKGRMGTSSFRASTTTASRRCSPICSIISEEYFWKPSAILCYSAGSFGGVRAAIALRAILGELGLSSIPYHACAHSSGCIRIRQHRRLQWSARACSSSPANSMATRSPSDREPESETEQRRRRIAVFAKPCGSWAKSRSQAA